MAFPFIPILLGAAGVGLLVSMGGGAPSNLVYVRSQSDADRINRLDPEDYRAMAMVVYREVSDAVTAGLKGAAQAMPKALIVAVPERSLSSLTGIPGAGMEICPDGAGGGSLATSITPGLQLPQGPFCWMEGASAGQVTSAIVNSLGGQGEYS